jgi:hypothetical protein
LARGKFGTKTDEKITYHTEEYIITSTLPFAEEAAVFFRQYISDHLPVYVEIQI